MSFDINQLIGNLGVNTDSQTVLSKNPQERVRGNKYESSPVCDTVQVSGKDEKWYQKYKKGFVTAGVGVLAVAGAVLGHRTIKANQIKKAEAEARKLEQEARQKAYEAEQKAKMEAAEREQAQRKAEAEARRQAKIEAEAKAKAKAEALAKRHEIDRLNNCAKWDLRDSLAANLPLKYALKEEHASYDYLYQLEKEGPFANIEKLPESIKPHVEKGADITPKEIAEFIEERFLKQADEDNNYYDRLSHLSSLGPNCQIEKELKKRDAVMREVVEELKKSENAEGKSVYEVFKDSIANVKNRHEAAKMARLKRVEGIFEHNNSETAKIRERLVYDENFEPKAQHIELTKEQKKALIDVLNQEAGINLTMDSSMNEIMNAWHWKYVGLPIKINKHAPEGERAILEMFPKYKGKVDDYIVESEFKHAPLYRFMHVDNPEEFLKQFEEIGSEYVPDTLQSCGKMKYYGEAYGGLNTRYNFVEWDDSKNIKLVIHPKGKHSAAADIGDTKYGGLEAIYPAGTRFKYVGKFQKTVTPEEVNKEMGTKFEFDDFQRYEIHLQEL